MGVRSDMVMTSEEEDMIDPNKIPPLTEEEVALAYQASSRR